LEPDNLLAFLTLLGLMRALDAQQPTWGCRLRWNDQRGPLQAELQLRESVTQQAIAEAVAAGCQQLAAAYDFSTPGRQWEFPRLKAEDARAELLSTVALGPEGRSRADLLASLTSDGASTESGTVLPTPLCLLFGQGHQFFLSRLSQNARAQAATLVGTKKVIREPTLAIRRALFQEWEREDRTPSLRWDTGWVHRQWFNRFSDPATDPVRTEVGAYILAAIGLPILTVSPVERWRRVRLGCVAVHEEMRELSVVWPIWTRTLSLAGIRTLLSHPAIYQNPPNRAVWSRLGIREVRVSGRVSVGKYQHFKRAAAI